MSKARLLALPLLLLPATAPAQGLDQRCLAVVEKLCGKRRLGACFASDAAWARVPERCVGDVQTLIENEREALSERRGGSRR